MRLMGLLRVALIVGACAGVTLLLASVNLWLGILSLPITYGISESLLAD